MSKKRKKPTSKNKVHELHEIALLIAIINGMFQLLETVVKHIINFINLLKG